MSSLQFPVAPFLYFQISVIKHKVHLATCHRVSISRPSNINSSSCWIICWVAQNLLINTTVCPNIESARFSETRCRGWGGGSFVEIGDLARFVPTLAQSPTFESTFCIFKGLKGTLLLYWTMSTLELGVSLLW